MAHIAEGLMHAYLDGALGPDGQLEWAAAEAHLDVCADCRERFEEARELRAKARELLAGAEPPGASGPGFAALAAEAEKRARPVGGGASWWRSTARLAWAASLVIAAGAGWIGHELLMQQGPSNPRSDARDPAAETAQAMAEGRRAVREEGAALDAAGAEVTEDADAAGRAAEPEAAAKLMAPRADRQLEDRSRDEITGRSCFAPRAEVREAGLPGPVGLLVLREEGTLRSEAGGRPLVGFWDALPADSLRLRLTDGSGWFEYRLARGGEGLSGISPDGDPVGFRPADCPQ